MESTSIQMGRYTRENGRAIRCMVKDPFRRMVAKFTMVTLRMTCGVDKEFKCTQMAQFIEAIGIKI